MSELAEKREYRFKGYEALVIVSEDEADYESPMELLLYKEEATDKIFTGIAMFDASADEWVVFGSEILFN